MKKEKITHTLAMVFTHILMVMTFGCERVITKNLNVITKFILKVVYSNH